MKLGGEISSVSLWNVHLHYSVARNLEVNVRKDRLSWFQDPYRFTQSLHPILDSYLEINDCRFLPNPYLLAIN